MFGEGVLIYENGKKICSNLLKHEFLKTVQSVETLKFVKNLPTLQS